MKLSQLPKSRVKLYLSSQPPQLLSAFTAPPSLMASIKTFGDTTDDIFNLLNLLSLRPSRKLLFSSYATPKRGVVEGGVKS